MDNSFIRIIIILHTYNVFSSDNSFSINSDTVLDIKDNCSSIINTSKEDDSYSICSDINTLDESKESYFNTQSSVITSKESEAYKKYPILKHLGHKKNNYYNTFDEMLEDLWKSANNLYADMNDTEYELLCGGKITLSNEKQELRKLFVKIALNMKETTNELKIKNGEYFNDNLTKVEKKLEKFLNSINRHMKKKKSKIKTVSI